MDGKLLARRSIAGLVFLVVVVAGLFSPVRLAVLVAALLGGLSAEFFRLTTGRRFRKEAFCIVLSMFLALALLYLHLESGLDLRWMGLAFFPVLLASVFLLFDAAADHAFPAALYVPLIYIFPALASMLLLAYYPDGGFGWRLLLGVFATVWCNDVGAYAVGMSFGQRPSSRKLFPALSPKKSWVGVLGGTVATFLAAWGVSAFFGASVLSTAHWMAIAAIVSVFGVFGDLFESLIKRHAQVKDAGDLIPGHGGLLDRFDGLLFVLPAVLLYLTLVQLR